MKTIYIVILTLLFILNSNAQNPIVDIEDIPSFFSEGGGVENTYYKDINNFFNPFSGTWVYTNGSTTFNIVLYKEIMVYGGKFYTDFLSGEYQYIENGIEKANTLNNANPNKHSIWGNSLLKSNHRPICNDCPINERRVKLIIADRIRHLGGSFTLKLTTVNGQPALEGYIFGSAPVIDVDNPPAFTTMIIPTGTFTFIKE